MNGNPNSPIIFVTPNGPAAFPGQGQNPCGPNIMVPIRVGAAMELLAGLHQKTMTRAAANDVSIELIEGQKLTSHENLAQQEACIALSNYFRGELRPDVWEKAQLQEVQGEIQRPGTLIRCFLCNPRKEPNPECILCQGSGQILTFPAGIKEDGSAADLSEE